LALPIPIERALSGELVVVRGVVVVVVVVVSSARTVSWATKTLSDASGSELAALTGLRRRRVVVVVVVGRVRIGCRCRDRRRVGQRVGADGSAAVH
jgi:hypothetical protein